MPICLPRRSDPSMKSKAKPFQPPRRTSRSPFDDAARQAEDDRPGEVGRGLGEHVGRVGHHHAARAGRGHVDVVVSHGHGGHDAQVRSGLQHGVVHRVGEHRHERLLAAHPFGQGIASQRLAFVQIDLARLLEARHRARGKTASNEDCRALTLARLGSGLWSLEPEPGARLMAVRLAIAAVVAGHRGLDEARAIRVHPGGQHELGVAQVGAQQRHRLADARVGSRLGGRMPAWREMASRTSARSSCSVIRARPRCPRCR